MYNADPIQETNINIISYPKYERLHLAMRKIRANFAAFQ